MNELLDGLGPAPAAVAGQSAAQRIEAELRRAIMALELRPGMRLSEQEVAQRLGTSRQPVREALIALSRQNLVEVLPQRGTVISRITVKQMKQARFVREAIETAIVRRACESFARGARERIDDLLHLQEAVAGRGDHGAFRRYDEMFHATLAEGADCALAWDSALAMKAHMDRVCELTLPGIEHMLPLVGQHREIVDAIDRSDADAAADAMRRHLTEILRALPRLEEEHPDLFE